MRAVEKLTASSWLTAWQFTGTAAVLGWALAAVLLVAYVALWVRGRRRSPDIAPSPLRLALFVILGVGTLLYALAGPAGVYSRTFLWIFGLQVSLLTAVTPLGLALGRPVELLCAATGSDAPRTAVAGRLGRALMYPMLSSVLAAASLIIVFFTGYGQAALDHGWVFVILVAHLLFVGTLVVLPLLTDDLLPEWATPGVHALLACVDGLLDAIPGILLMTRSHLAMPHFPGFSPAAAHLRDGLSPTLDQRFTGGAVLAVAESIGIPLLIAVFVDWQRADRRTAIETDQRLDAELGEGQSLSTPWWLQQQTTDPSAESGEAPIGDR